MRCLCFLTLQRDLNIGSKFLNFFVYHIGIFILGNFETCPEHSAILSSVRLPLAKRSLHSYLHRITYHHSGKAPNILPNSTKNALRIPFVRDVLSLTRGNPKEVKCFKLDGPNYISQFFTPRAHLNNVYFNVNFTECQDRARKMRKSCSRRNR